MLDGHKIGVCGTLLLTDVHAYFDGTEKMFTDTLEGQQITRKFHDLARRMQEFETKACNFFSRNVWMTENGLQSVKEGGLGSGETRG